MDAIGEKYDKCAYNTLKNPRNNIESFGVEGITEDIFKLFRMEIHVVWYVTFHHDPTNDVHYDAKDQVDDDNVPKNGDISTFEHYLPRIFWSDAPEAEIWAGTPDQINQQEA